MVNSLLLVFLLFLESIEAPTFSDLTKCLGNGGNCAIEETSRPSILTDVVLTSSSLPSLNVDDAVQGSVSSPIALSDILNQITGSNASSTQALKHSSTRALIIEAGLDSPISWQLSDCNLLENTDSSTAETSTDTAFTDPPIFAQQRSKSEIVAAAPISISALLDSLNSSFVPPIQTTVSTGLPLYRFAAQSYSGVPGKLLSVGDSCRISFIVERNLTAQELRNVCRTSSLLFALLPSTDTESSSDVSVLDLADCTTCTSLPISREFLRLCPYIDGSDWNGNGGPFNPNRPPTVTPDSIIDILLNETNARTTERAKTSRKDPAPTILPTQVTNRMEAKSTVTTTSTAIPSTTTTVRAGTTLTTSGSTSASTRSASEAVKTSTTMKSAISKTTGRQSTASTITKIMQPSNPVTTTNRATKTSATQTKRNPTMITSTTKRMLTTIENRPMTSIPVRTTTPAPTTTTSLPTTTVPAPLNVSVPLYPTVLDASSDETVTITLNISSIDVASASVRKCFLSSSQGNFDASSVALDRKTSILSLTVHQSLFDGDASVNCNLTAGGREMLISGSSSIAFLQFNDFVIAADDFISSIPLGVERKYVSISFTKNPLDARLAGKPYCLTVDGARFNASGQLDKIVCDISSLSKAGNYSLFGIRSEIMENATRLNQSPTMVLITDLRTTTSTSTTTSTTSAPTTTTTMSTTVPTTTVLITTPTTTKTTTKTSTTSTSTTTTATTTVRTTTARTTTKKKTIPTTTMASSTSTTARPTTSTMQTTSTTTAMPTTTSVAAFSSITMLDSLLGLEYACDGCTIAPSVFICSQFFVDHANFGVNASCSSTGRGLLISFGSGATVRAKDQLAITKAFNVLLEPTIQHLVVESPVNAVSPDYTVSYTQEVMTCVPSTDIELKQLTGSGNREMTYRWGSEYAGLSPSLSAETGRKVTIPTKLLQVNWATMISVSACNFMNKCTNQSVDVLLSNAAATFTVAINGMDSRVVASKKLALTTTTAFLQCNASLAPSDVTYSWKLGGAEVSKAGSYRIPAYFFTPNATVQLTLEAAYTYNGKKYTAADAKLFTVEIEPLVAIVDAAQRTSPIDSSVSLDASASFDPNFAVGLVIHSWSCTNLSGLLNSTCDLQPSVDLTSSVLVIPAYSLQANLRLSFTDSIRSVNISSLTATVTTLVDTVAARSPIIRFESLAKEKFNTDEFVRIRAFVSSSSGNLTAVWQMSLDGVDIDLTPILSTPVHSFSAEETSASEFVVLSLTIPPGGQSTSPSFPGLLPGRLYSVSLAAENGEGESAGFINLQMNSPPTVGSVEIDPASLTALAPFTASLGDGWSDTDLPLSISFGIRSILADGTSSSVSLPSSLATSTPLVLPSASAKGKTCGGRVGYTITTQVCDRLSACSYSESSQFTVARSTNLTAALDLLTQQIEDEIDNGNTWVALPLLEAMRAENCSTTMDTASADKIVTSLLGSVDETSDACEYRDVLTAVTRAIPSLSSATQMKAFSFVTKYQRLIGIETSSSRRKRSTQGPTSNDNTLLPFFDTLFQINSNESSTLVSYFPAIESLLSASCAQLDESTPRIISQTGGIYTSIQAQALVPASTGFVGTKFTIAGVTSGVISFDSSFVSAYSRWQCEASSQCLSVCLGSLRINYTAVTASSYLQNALFPGVGYPAINASVSNLHKIYIMNPMSGAIINEAVTYTVNVPMTSYAVSSYYGCFIQSSTSSSWTKCTSANYAIKTGSSYYMPCSCIQTGLLAVFTVAAPTPPDVPSYNEIRLTISLSSTTAPSTAQRSTLIDRLANATGLRSTRFVSISTVDASTVQATMRPASRSDDLVNNYAIQSILRVIGVDAGYVAYDSVKITNVTYEPILRVLTNDGYARKLIVNIDASFSTILGTANTTAPLVAAWTAAVYGMLRISPYRVKNAVVDRGVVFNFTFTLPFDEEQAPKISAEELSIMMQESVVYGELDLASTTGGKLSISPIADGQIVILIPLPKSNSLVLILVITISTILLITGLYVGGAVLFKIRADFLLEEERKRFIMVDPASLHPPPPVYPADVNLPPEDPRDRLRVRTAY